MSVADDVLTAAANHGETTLDLLGSDTSSGATHEVVAWLEQDGD